MKLRTLLPLLLLFAVILSACVVPAPGAPAAQPAAIPETYAKPDVLVDTDWLVEHADDENVVLLAVGTDAEAFAANHIPGARFVHGGADITNPEDSTRGQILTQEALSALLSKLGVEQDSTVVLYDDGNNLWSTRAYWVLKYYQHNDVRVYNGGSGKWQADGQALTADVIEPTPSEYVAGDADLEIRTTAEYVMEHVDDPDTVMCDTRNPEEYAGTDVRSARGGHVPGAINVEWTNAVNSDGTFKSATDLYNLYTKAGFVPDKQIITYCQTGVRGAHTWFVLRELLGFPNVRNYDGSWEEYGNMADAPIEQ